MKKVLALVLCAVLMFALALPAMAVVSIPANKSAITVDGVRDEAYGATSTPIAALKADTDPNAATGRVWMAWDDTHVYYYAEIDDKTPNHAQANEDNLEFMIDWNSGKGDADIATPETPFWQVRAFASGANENGEKVNGLIMDAAGVDWSRAFAEELAPYCNVFSGPLNGDYKNGYVIEMAITAPSGVTLSEGKTIPVEFQICDNILGEGTREGQVFLEVNDNNDTQWHTPNACNGLITLGGAYVAPAPVVEATAAPEAAAPAVVAEAPAAVVAAPAPVAAQTSDSSAMIFVGLGIALAGAVVLTKRVSKSKV